MTNRIARRFAASVALAALGLATPALAQDKTVKIGVLNDMSSLYADIGGPNSVVAVKMAVEDSGLTKKGWKIDVVSGDHQNKPDVGVNHRAAVDRQREGRCDRRYAELRRCARRQQPRQGKERGAAQFRCRDRRPHRQGLHAEHDLLHLRHLHARERHRQGADQGRRRQLVLPDRRLCLRSCARARHIGGRDRQWRQGARRRQASAQHRRTSRPSCCRRRPPRRRSSGLPMPAATPPTAIKQAAEFGIVAGGQKLAALLLFINDVHSLGLKTAQGLTFTESFYWDMNDADARLVEAVLRARQQERDAVDDPGRQLRHGAALSEGDGSARRQSA